MTKAKKPSLFGLTNSNRDFTTKRAWGKNQFNSSFPAALCCYLHSRELTANYLSMNRGVFEHRQITIDKAFNINPLEADVYFAFESLYTPFQQYVVGSLPRTDLVIQKRSSGKCLASIEVKLTALPDNTTCELEEESYGSEIVVRPDTIVYLACSIAKGLGNTLRACFPQSFSIKDWSDAQNVLPFINNIVQQLKEVAISLEDRQTPFLLQPVWKTKGKSPQLADYCLDVFFWSDAGFTDFITNLVNMNPKATKITRQTRTAIWLYKMLSDIADSGRFDHAQIIDNCSYNTRNDKAFASAGNVTSSYMACQRLKKPIVKKDEIKNIILGGGQALLSPERRFDAIIYNSPELFI